MQFRKVAALAGALLMMGAFAMDALAQRPDRDERRRFREREWVLLGEKSVGFGIDRDIVRINQSEEWYRTRSFRRLHLVADRSDVYMVSIRLVYLNGFGEEFRVDQLIKDGEDMPIDLRGDRSFIKQIEMTYRSRPNFRGEALMRVYGEPVRMPGPGPMPGPGSGPQAWVDLGCQKVSLFGKDKDSLEVGPREGRFKAIRLHVRGADVNMLDLKVVYGSGKVDDIPVRSVIRQGERTGPLDLKGFDRRIARVDMTYRTIPNFKGQATVCVEGLQ